MPELKMLSMIYISFFSLKLWNGIDLIFQLVVVIEEMLYKGYMPRSPYVTLVFARRVSAYDTLRLLKISGAFPYD